MDKVLVLMSTFNGERFVKEQLDSLLRQEGVDAHMLIRDDGSTDGTCGIIGEYAEKHPNISILAGASCGKNLGVPGSFYALADEAYQHCADYSYYAWCDQDDVWLPDKLKRACAALDGLNGSSTKLYASAYQKVDDCLNPLPTAMCPSLQTFGDAIVIQPTIGCTFVFNREVLRLFLKGRPEDMLMHDSWMYKMVLGCGGAYHYDKKPSILYRQHGGNLKGDSKTFLDQIAQTWDNFYSNRRSRSFQCMGLLRAYREDLTQENLKILSDFVACRRSVAKRIKVAFSRKYRTAGHAHGFRFRMAVLLGKA